MPRETTGFPFEFAPVECRRMPIQVTCPGCKAQFNVSEKFAGKKGPCPKCKAVITIPAAEPAPAAAASSAGSATAKSGAAPPKPPAPAAADVKIHAPEEAQKGEKTKTGRPTSKPIEHRDVRFTWKLVVLVVGTTIALFVAAWFGGRLVQGPPPLLQMQEGDAEVLAARRMPMLIAYALRAAAILLIGWPIVLAGYGALRDDELEPYRGRSLYLRTIICLTVYIGVWGIYALIPDDLVTQPYMWAIFAPAMILPAAAAAYFCFDLDYLGATMHALFFLAVTTLLGWTAGLGLPWSDNGAAPRVTDSMEIELPDEYKPTPIKGTAS
jgi:hypothetical protein